MAEQVVYGMNPDALGESDRMRKGSEEEPQPGELLALPIDSYDRHHALASKVLRMWHGTNTPAHKKRMEQWKVNRLQREGIAGVQLVKTRDMNEWRAWLPPVPRKVIVNRLATLCRKLVNILLADPPAPDPVPKSGSDEDEASAEFAGRALIDIQSESGTNEIDAMRKALARATTNASGFVRYFIDPRGGGKGPVAIQAGREATSLDDALGPMNPVMGEPDPITGEPQPQLDEMGEPVMEQGEWPEYVDRFVTPDNMLTDEEAEARETWLPLIKREVLDGRNVRFIPANCEDIWDARMVIVGCFTPWGKLREMLSPEVQAMVNDDVKQKLFSFAPERSDDLLPRGEKLRGKAENEDDTLVFTPTIYAERSSEYPNGLYLIAAADCLIVHRGEWCYEDEGRKLPMLIPITQYKLWDETAEDPYGNAPAEWLVSGNEVRSSVAGNTLDYMDKLNKRLKFLPSNSIISPKQLQNPQGTVLAINPGGEPKYEDIPTMPREGMEMYAVTTQEMDNALGLEGAAQASDAGNDESGRARMALISQAHAQLSEPKQHVERGYKRACRIQQQLALAYYTKPRRVRWVGEDGEYKERFWSRSDLNSTVDISIDPTTMTMLAPSAKIAFAKELAALGILPMQELQEAIRTNAGGMIQIQDDPFRMRIKRQIAEWIDGPPDMWQPPMPTQGVDPLTGAPMLQPGTDPELARIWAPVPSDLLPGVAQIRLDELARLTASRRYERKPPEWRIAVEMEFQRMSMAAAMAAPQPQGSGKPGEQPKQDNGEPQLDPQMTPKAA